MWSLVLIFNCHIKCVFVNIFQFTAKNSPGSRCGSRIWSRGGPQPPRPKVADVAKRSRASEASPEQAGVQGPLKGPGSFWVFNAQICILLHSRDSFSFILTASSTPKIVHYILFYIFMKNCVFENFLT